MRAKICGITRLQDALYAVEHGAWALGFNFYQKSPRYITFAAAKQLILQLPTNVLKVGIFIEESDEAIENQMQALQLDFAQVYIHKQRSPALMKKMLLGLQVASVQDLPDESILNAYAAILLDAPKDRDELWGGTGRKSNWVLASELAKRHRLILAGGLTAEQLHSVIETVQPYAVDVASGIEVAPGQKDASLLQVFLGACHGSK